MLASVPSSRSLMASVSLPEKHNKHKQFIFYGESQSHSISFRILTIIYSVNQVVSGRSFIFKERREKKNKYFDIFKLNLCFKSFLNHLSYFAAVEVATNTQFAAKMTTIKYFILPRKFIKTNVRYEQLRSSSQTEQKNNKRM